MEYNADTKSTEKLLSYLDDEIEKKCFQIKQKKNEERMKKTFFSCCISIIIVTIIGLVANISIINIVESLFLFQSLALTFVLPFILNLNKEVTLNEENR